MTAGTSCWIELAAADATAAQRFYGELFGWEFHLIRDPATANRRYTIVYHEGVQVAGLYQASSSQPTGWIMHLQVANTATTAGWVENLGGTLTLGPVDLPDRGSILHALDPSGAPIVFWQVPEDWYFGTGRPGMFSGADLNTYDTASADNFYCRLFQFTSQQIGTSNIDYAEWRLDREPVLYRCGMDPEDSAGAPPHWMVYFSAEPARGADATAGQALMLGGQVVTPPFDTPFGRTAVLADPDGSTFSIIDHSRPVDTGYGKAEVDDPYDD